MREFFADYSSLLFRRCSFICVMLRSGTLTVACPPGTALDSVLVLRYFPSSE